MKTSTRAKKEKLICYELLPYLEAKVAQDDIGGMQLAYMFSHE